MIIPVLLTTAFLAADVHFQRHDIAEYPATYQVAVADINGDGKPDVLALSTQGNRVDWFENPSWRQHPIARTERNIDLAPFDLGRNGQPGIALASGFYFAEGNRGGEIQWLTPGAPGQLWQSQPIARDPVVHRLRWGDLDGDGQAGAGPRPHFRAGLQGTGPGAAIAPLGLPPAQTSRRPVGEMGHRRDVDRDPRAVRRRPGRRRPGFDPHGQF